MKPFIKNLEQLFRWRSDRSSQEPNHWIASLFLLTAFGLLIGANFANKFTPANSTAPLAHPPIVEADSKLLTPATPIRQSKQGGGPQSGWIYVLDSNRMNMESQVLLLDPSDGRIVRTFRAGYNPDMALSPDGKRLYISSSRQRPTPEGLRLHGSLEVIDTATGAILQTADNPDRLQPTVWEYQSHMALSLDGRWLYMLKHIDAKNDDVYYIATFDTTRGQFLPERPLLPHCINGVLLPSPRPLDLKVMCTGLSDIRFLRLTKRGSAVISRLALHGTPNTHGEYVGQAFLSPDGSRLKVLMQDGRSFEADSESRSLIHSDAIDSQARKINISDGKTINVSSDDWMAGRGIPLQRPTTSPDGAKLFVGIGRLTDFSQSNWSFDEVAVLDPATLSRTATIKTSILCYSMAVSKDGRFLYGVDPTSASLVIVDIGNAREIRTISGIGVTPILATVAP